METIAENLIRKRQPKDDEYLENGIIHCKKCKTPRQFYGELFGTKGLFFKNCDCQQKENEERELAKIREATEKRRQSMIRNPSYRNYTFQLDDGQTPRTAEICKKYVEKFDEFKKFGGGLILWGSVGTGKTFYAMCIANALFDRDVNVLSTTLADIVKLAQDFDNAEYHLERLMRKELIVIDDLGAERGTDFANEQIYKFINEATTHNIPLIFTTNYSPDILHKAAESTSDLTFARIYSRILEKCTPIAVLDVKRRANKEKANYQKATELLGLK